jgi:hypothetical protein
MSPTTFRIGPASTFSVITFSGSSEFSVPKPYAADNLNPVDAGSESPMEPRVVFKLNEEFSGISPTNEIVPEMEVAST